MSLLRQFSLFRRGFVQLNRKKSYADQEVSDIIFLEGEKVLLKILPMKGVMRFGNMGKLSPRFIDL